MKESQRGSAIIMLLIAVALFAMVTYAFLQGSRGNVGMMTSEAAKVAGYTSQDCTNSVNMGMKRLKARGCGTMISMNADGSNSSPGAPSDGSCSLYHPNGGGVQNCNNAVTVCSASALTALTVGTACGDIAYVGVVDGRRIYTSLTDVGNILFSVPGNFNLGAVSMTDGFSNTAAFVAADGGSGDFPAAMACKALGPEWYIPTMHELNEMCNVQNTGVFNGTYQGNNYISSEEFGLPGIDYAMHAWSFLYNSTSTSSKGIPSLLRCVRRD